MRLRSRLGSWALWLGLCASGAGCGSDHPDLKPGDKIGVDDILNATDSNPIGSETGGQLIGAPLGSGNAGSGGANGNPPAAPVCGNGTIEAPEMCDGANLGGASCAQLGFAGGTLICDPATCSFDDSMCMSGAGGAGGTGG